MPWSGVKRLRLRVSSSSKKWPDIWVTGGKIPVITVTEEWMKQGVHERRKRLVHEVIGHLAFGWEHSELMSNVGFSTYPDKDNMSRIIYADLLKGQVRHPNFYIRKALK